MKSTETQEHVQYGTNANETDKQNYSELLKRDHIEGTPFVIVTELGKGSFITMGNYRLTDIMRYDQCWDKIKDRDWDLMVTVMGILVEKFNEAKAMEELTKTN